MAVVERDEIDEILEECARAHKMVYALRDGLNFVNGKLQLIEEFLRVMDLRIAYLGEDDEDED